MRVVFGQKITVKLTLMVFALLAVLTAVVITAQFFFVSRYYVTTDYTRQRVDDLLERAEGLQQRGLGALLRSDREQIDALLNQFADENHAYCVLMDGTAALLGQSDNMAELGGSYLAYVQKLLESGALYDYDGTVFRVQNAWRFPTRYVGTYQTVQLGDWQTEGIAYLVILTREVYTAGEYTVLRRFSLVIFVITLLVSCAAAVLFARRLTRPILRMEATARRMSNLDFSEKCDYRGRDELGGLAASLNFLSDKLKDSIGQLQSANRRLQQDLGAQQEIDRMRRQFIASVSHEFKTLLTLLRGYLEMMQDEVLPDEARREARAVMVGEIDRLDRLVLDMLELSRLETAEQPMVRVPFCMSDVVTSCGRQMVELFRSRGIAWSVVGESGRDSTVYGDPDAIGHVLTNFLSNALVHTPSGGRVELRVEPQGSHVRVSVFNQGEPIPQQALAMVWQPFYRTDRSRAQHDSGTGLGLAICREILEKHGCEYGVENTRDGVLFYFVLS